MLSEIRQRQISYNLTFSVESKHQTQKNKVEWGLPRATGGGGNGEMWVKGINLQ